MNIHLSQHFSLICGKLCNILYLKDYNKSVVNSLIDELNAQPYKSEQFVLKSDAISIISALCLNVKPADEFLATKTSHLINSIVTKQGGQFATDFLTRVVLWHIDCVKRCSEIILPDILHNMQCILQFHPQAGHKLTDELIGVNGIIINSIENNKCLTVQNSSQIHLIALKCISSLLSTTDDKNADDCIIISPEIKDKISHVCVSFLIKGATKNQDQFQYCKVIITALRVLSQLYFNDPTVNIPLPEVMGICRYFILYGLNNQGSKLEKILPSQQNIAVTPVQNNPPTRGGKKQKLRKQRNKAIETLKKEIPVSDRSLMKDVDNFENNSAYKPANQYLEPQSITNAWTLTSDSDMSDVENSREAKLVALKSRVRQSAANLLLVLVKVKEKKEIFGYWWALLPDSPDPQNWSSEESSKKTLAYCAVTDPIASSRASVLSVILALLSGSKVYLSQAETSKKENTSFIPFSVSLGYMITCLHKILIGILDSERSHSVIIVALKCCAALVQATPYHKMKEGLISELVKSTRKFLVHRAITLQVGALITMECVLSVDPKVDEIITSIEKDAERTEMTYNPVKATNDAEECDDFEEGYSDDEMFCAASTQCTKNEQSNEETGQNFRSWILDICFKNMGWIVRDNEITRCNPSAIPVVLESLQVLSAIAFHHLYDLLSPHIMLLGDILNEMLQHEHQDVVVHSARTISIIGDAIKKLEQEDQSPPLNHCVYMWEKLITPLSAVLQSHENIAAKAIVCDCIANIGERSFKELPRHIQVLCCALLVGSCSDEEPTIRAAAVRALAMAVIYRSLREDMCFVSDCGENILRALAEPTLVVRTKAAWALANLSDALVLNLEEPDMDDIIDDDLLVRLLDVSIKCATDNDKVKMSATRSLGNLLRLIDNDILERNPQSRPLCESAIEKLMDCACKVTNMKVRWNACYAMGNAMKNDHLFTCFNGWQGDVWSKLGDLCCSCKNLKVRINAAAALRGARARAQYAAHFTPVWRAVMAAMERAANVDDFTEYKHKDNLIEQLCVTLAHLCCLMTQSDLGDILDPLVFHYDDAKALFAQLCYRLPPENASCSKILQAAKHVTVDLTADNDAQSQSLAMLQNIFIWEM